jgi:SAM-dependent methyltransferase
MKRLRRVFGDLRTEGAGRMREAVAIGLGAFIGCSPWYGFHFLLCWAVGWCLRLNRLKMYLAANISNPLMAPVLVLSELETGAWIRRGQTHLFTLATVRQIDPWQFAGDLIVGSVVVGAALGILAGAGTYWMAGGGDDEPWFATIVQRAADRYLSASITAWEFARGKLRGDPVYRAVIASANLPSGGTLLEVGCGQGLMLAVLAEAATAWRTGEWPHSLAPPPRFDRLVGIETRRRVALMAQEALADVATILAGDARIQPFERTRVALFLDVLHMMPASDQERLLMALAESLDEGGVVVVREPDAARGPGFHAVRVGNQLKAIVTGNWRQTFHFRTSAEWIACFERLGFQVDRMNTSEGTPFANELFVLRARRRTSG